MRITKDSIIGELLEKDPEISEPLMDCGMHCIGCPSSQRETLEQAAMVHGIPIATVLEALADYQAEKLERGF